MNAYRLLQRTGFIMVRPKFTSTVLRELLEVKDYRALQERSSSAAAFIERSTEHEETALLKRVRMQYSEIVFSVPGGRGYWT